MLSKLSKFASLDRSGRLKLGGADNNGVMLSWGTDASVLRTLIDSLTRWRLYYPDSYRSMFQYDAQGPGISELWPDAR